jgi:hypothetical protein
MLTAGGRAPPFGDLAKCATAAGADETSQHGILTFWLPDSFPDKP